MAAKYDIVLVDTNALSYDLAEMGLTAVKFSQCCGKADKWLSSIIYRKRVDRGTVEFIEDRMFKDRGTRFLKSRKRKLRNKYGLRKLIPKSDTSART